MDSQSACSNLGITSTKTCCQGLRVFAEIPWINVFGEQADEDDQIDGIDDFVGTLYAYLISVVTESFGTLEREMAWKPGDDCTASTRHRPCDSWRSFRRFRTHRVVSELRIWELHWRIGSQETSIRDVHRQERTALPGIR